MDRESSLAADGWDVTSVGVVLDPSAKAGVP